MARPVDLSMPRFTAGASSVREAESKLADWGRETRMVPACLNVLYSARPTTAMTTAIIIFLAGWFMGRSGLLLV